MSRVLPKLMEDREWLFIGCDGPPYCLFERIAEKCPGEFDFAIIYPWVWPFTNEPDEDTLSYFRLCLETLGKEVLNFQSKCVFFFCECK